MPVLSLDQFRAAAKADSVPDDTELRITSVCDSIVAVKEEQGDGVFPDDDATEDGDLKFKFTISTATDDRCEDSIAVDGWDLKAYEKNPVVLWAHDQRALPIAKATGTVMTDGKLVSVADFTDTVAVVPMAKTVAQLLRHKVLNAASVGFRALRWSHKDSSTWGLDFLETELLEWSVVPVPANPEALQDAKSYGVDLTPYVGWAESVLDGAGASDAWMSKVYHALKISSGSPVSVSVPGDVESKAGRVLSAKNEESIRGAVASIEAATQKLEGVMAKLSTDEEDEDKKEADGVVDAALLLDDCDDCDPTIIVLDN